MKFRYLLLCLLALSLGTATADAASKKKNKKVAKVEIPALKSVSSSAFSYAIGMAQVPSLLQFVQQRHGVDSTQIENFISGLRNNYSEAEIARMRSIVAGSEIGHQIIQQNVPLINRQATGKEDTTYVNTDLLLQGLIEGLRGGGTLTPDSAAKIVESQFKYQEEQVKKANADFLVQYKKQKGVKATSSGLLYKVVKQGTGALPADTAQVEVHYEGKLIDGTVFDSSYQRGQTATFGVTQVIKGWTEALKMMPVGSEYELCIPYELAYGERGTRGIPPYSTLVFKVELIAIK
ncbi:FKBP-type peptidyl-prolyl cis-trans isomerase [Alloprevotella sp. OH1205_COT-284]|uniref:FKBP-type peptidyl-prolyl cis-trans isomerase n=1 Tax=Alloprevotella sp. OH1205_COT-284 TaxID=2491043 RepID=UPI0013154C6B|nr:FKBP-type peptidyl-prolyl cis-trans isomerase [Alloprevotella sp. OH1205_COT-284]